MWEILILLSAVISVAIALLTDVENQEVFEEIGQGFEILNCWT